MLLRLGVLAAVTVAPAALVAACGGGNGPDTPEEERIRQINGVAELAANAYASVGAEGLYDYLAPDIVANCSQQDLVAALADDPVPDGFRRIDGVTFDGDTARAFVVQLFGEEEREAEWTFVLEDENRWRITSVPGLDRCTD